MKHILTTFITALFTTAIATILLASCTSEEYFGDAQQTTKGTTISFSGATSKLLRASTFTGVEAAQKLDDKFVVYGTKTTSTTTQTVFDHYNIAYTAGSEHTTASNTSGWEYVGKDPNPLNDKLTSASLTQDIKFWDFGADHYDYIAFSTGTATQQDVTGTAGDPGYPGTATAGSVIVTPVDAANATTAAYTITGAPADICKCYIADRITATKDAAVRDGISYPYLDPMRFNFRSLGAKVRVGLYETISGYSVKDVKFYRADDTYETVLGTTPPLFFASDAYMPTDAATMVVSFPTEDPAAPGYNKAQVALQTIAGHKSRDISLSTLSTGYVAEENLEGGLDGEGNHIAPGTVFLGRSSNAATMSEYHPIAPTGTGYTLTLKMDYTLLSTDISRETITVRGATAVIPAEFCNWQPNTAYTYLFKITANTNGWTNPNQPYAGLYPVTLDALVAATEEGVQQTITLMDAPSITTYAKGERIHEEDGTKLNYYERGDYNLYICLQPNTMLMDADNVRMFTVSGASSFIEATAADVIKNGTESPAGTFTLDPFTMTIDGAPALNIVEEIPAADAPYNTAISGNFAVFQPTTAGTYVFEYTSPEEYYTYDEYHALTGNEGVTQSDYDSLVASNSPLLLKPNKHYKVIVVK